MPNRKNCISSPVLISRALAWTMSVNRQAQSARASRVLLVVMAGLWVRQGAFDTGGEMPKCGRADEGRALGHQAKLISPQFVRPFVKGNKNDFVDEIGRAHV